MLTTERKVAALQWKTDRNFLNWLSKLTSSKMGQNSVFSSACMLSRFSRVWLFVTPWTVACQAPLSMRFSRQEYWSGLPFPAPGYGMSDKNITWIYSWENVRSTQIEGHFIKINQLYISMSCHEWQLPPPPPPPAKKTLQKYNVTLDWILYQKKEKKKLLKRPFLGHWQNLSKICWSANRVVSTLDVLNLMSMQCMRIFLWCP